MDVSKNSKTVILVVLGAVVVMYLLSELVPFGIDAGNTLNASLASMGFPTLGSFFASGGLFWIVLILSVLIALILGALKLLGNSKH